MRKYVNFFLVFHFFTSGSLAVSHQLWSYEFLGALEPFRDGKFASCNGAFQGERILVVEDVPDKNGIVTAFQFTLLNTNGSVENKNTLSAANSLVGLASKQGKGFALIADDQSMSNHMVALDADSKALISLQRMPLSISMLDMGRHSIRYMPHLDTAGNPTISFNVWNENEVIRSGWIYTDGDVKKVVEIPGFKLNMHRAVFLSNHQVIAAGTATNSVYGIYQLFSNRSPKLLLRAATYATDEVADLVLKDDLVFLSATSEFDVNHDIFVYSLREQKPIWQISGDLLSVGSYVYIYDRGKRQVKALREVIGIAGDQVIVEGLVYDPATETRRNFVAGIQVEPN